MKIKKYSQHVCMQILQRLMTNVKKLLKLKYNGFETNQAYMSIDSDMIQ